MAQHLADFEASSQLLTQLRWVLIMAPATSDEDANDYARQFESLLQQRVAGTTEGEGASTATDAMFSLFSPSEIMAGSQVAHLLGMSHQEAVACFVFASECAADEPAAKHQESETKDQKVRRGLLSHNIAAELKEIDAARLNSFVRGYSRQLSADR